MRRAELARTRRTSVRNYVRLFNTRLRDGESMRVYPLSNRTEHDVWEYLAAEEIDVVPLYFAAVRAGGQTRWGLDRGRRRASAAEARRAPGNASEVPHSGMLSADGNDRVWGGKCLPRLSPNCATRGSRSDPPDRSIAMRRPR